MTANEMRQAVAEIRAGISYQNSRLEKNSKTKAQWDELYSEIHYGYNIDAMPSLRIIYQNKIHRYDRA